MKFALVGNQNSGKTTLFNELTGSNQRVGNFPGVTVDRMEGDIRGHEEHQVIDLPGIYSLSPYSSEEIVSRDFIIKEKPDSIINIVDAMNIERNLYLTLQLIELEVPMVIALNMMDELRANGGSIDVAKMEEEIGVPVIPISAIKKEGINELLDRLIETGRTKTKPKRLDFCEGPVHRAIHSVSHLVEDHAEMAGLPARYSATRLVEGDKLVEEQLVLDENERDMLDHIVSQLETESGYERREAMADMRYTFIENLTKPTVKKPKESKELLRSVKFDRILTHKYFGIPIFLGIMLSIFFMTFSVLGAPLSDFFSDLVFALGEKVVDYLSGIGLNPIVISLIENGVFGGVGSVMSFLPIIVVLFFFLSILEDTGYMARVAFIMDGLLRKIGLSGSSIVPMLLGFGCTVPAILSTRTLASERDRKMTLLLTPFMSCSAKIPIYGMFTLAFFPENRALIMTSLYLLGIAISILFALILKETKPFKGNPVPFVMELPNYRMPALNSVWQLLKHKIKDFITRAFTVIFLASLVIWFLSAFDSRLFFVDNTADSLLSEIGGIISPLFKPLGFGNWIAGTALLTGLVAKETVISTLAVLLNAQTSALPDLLQSMFTPQSAYAFLVFCLLYTPCFASIAALNVELKSPWKTAIASIGQIGIAWIVTFVVYRMALLF